MSYTLVLGSKNLSSWSLRPWLAMRQFGLDFTEVVIELDRPETQAQILAHSPAGRVPVLKFDDEVVWDSLAILETLAERHGELPFWPRDARARVRARSIAAEMHAGFAAMRDELPMDCRLRTSTPPLSADALDDIARVRAIWRDARAAWGDDGAFLFGRFCIADAMYAPVVSRFVSYAVELDAPCRAYVDAMMALPAMQAWLQAAEAGPGA